MEPENELVLLDNSSVRQSVATAIQGELGRSERMDVATGYFEVGGFLALGEAWKHLGGVRILLGAHFGSRTRQMLLAQLGPYLQEKFGDGLDRARRKDPLLDGLLAITEAMREGRVECRVHVKNGKKFHAKAYVLHGRDEDEPIAALVGSSNFTRPGLEENTELNVQYADKRATRELANWFEERWEESEEFTDQFLDVLERTVREYGPREIYLKSVYELLDGRDLTVDEWEASESVIYPMLDESQKRGYRQLLAMATGSNARGGAFLCDGVGMGKTFIGLMLIERFCRREKKRVALFAPKSAKEAVWEKEVPARLPGLDTVYGQKIKLFAHTDLHRTSEGWPQTFAQVRDEADVVIIDESHYFRNKGSKEKAGEERSWYRKLYDLIENPDGSRKTVFLLTATPINNGLKDFQHQAELFLGENDPGALAHVGIGSLPTEIKNLEKAIIQAEQDPANVPAALKDSSLFRELVVQRSRSFAKEMQEKDPDARELSFPERKPPRVAKYSLRDICGALLDQLERTLVGDEPSLRLSLYYPLQYDLSGDPDGVAVNRQKQLVGLIRTLLVKRLESSVRSFESSCLAILKKMIAFCEQNSLEGPEADRLEAWRGKNTAIYGDAENRQLELWDEAGDPTKYDEEDFVPQELVEGFEQLDRKVVDVPKVLEDTYTDMEHVMAYLDLVGQVDDSKDRKVLELIRMIREEEGLIGRKVIVFTEFAQTARYLEKRLREAGFKGVESVTSRSKKDRGDVVARFSPFYNGTTPLDLQTDGKDEIEILVSTDMLADGLNLQDATRLINYDIHWNPVQIIQRIGRVDRRLDPTREDAIREDRKAQGLNGDRGEVVYWNFLPPDDLGRLINLMSRVSRKVFTISATLGIQTGHLLRPDEDLEEVKLLERYEEFVDGVQSVEEQLQIELRDLFTEDPELEGRLQAIPRGVRSGRLEASGELVQGVFFCLRLPGRDMEASATGEAVWNLEAGRTAWYYVPLGGDEEEVIEDLAKIRKHIRSEPGEERHVRLDDETLLAAKKRVDSHVRKTHTKRLQVPQGQEPDLITWMEVHTG